MDQNFALRHMNNLTLQQANTDNLPAFAAEQIV
jgi:hypothetical protein